MTQSALSDVCLGPEGSVCQLCVLRASARGSTEERHVSITRNKVSGL